jgi:hypothetical protein
MPQKKLWIYPLIFGVLGVFLGFLLRFAFTGSLGGFPYKNVLHAHSHVLLLGFIFNALLIFVWIEFTKGIDRVSFYFFLALQICMTIMVIAFILQGYAFYSILFSTLHLFLSYILLIRLWKRLEGSSNLVLLTKIGIILHFVASVGPYALGPLMVMNLKSSPWYQQAIFFYLHFQFFGTYFVWMLALLFEKVQLKVSKSFIYILITSLALGYAHSLDYNFEHWSIQVFGGIGTGSLVLLLFSVGGKFIKKRSAITNMYFIILLVSLLNFSGSFPFFANLAVQSRFVLIAWLHFLFLGMYVPFIWIFLHIKMEKVFWILYASALLVSEVFLIFPVAASRFLSMEIMWLLFYGYLAVFTIILWAHLVLIYRNCKRTLSVE